MDPEKGCCLYFSPKHSSCVQAYSFKTSRMKIPKGWGWLAFTRNLMTKGSVICTAVTQCWVDLLIFNEYSAMIPVPLWQRCLMLEWNRLKASLTLFALSCVSAAGMGNRVPLNELWGECRANGDNSLDFIDLSTLPWRVWLVKIWVAQIYWVWKPCLFEGFLPQLLCGFCCSI